MALKASTGMYSSIISTFACRTPYSFMLKLKVSEPVEKCADHATPEDWLLADCSSSSRRMTGTSVSDASRTFGSHKRAISSDESELVCSKILEGLSAAS